MTVDHEGRILEFNNAARRAFGYTRTEVLGREVADKIVPPELRDDLRRRLRDFVVTGDNADLGRRREATAMRADGTLFPVEVVAVPAYVKGRVLLTAYIRDLTDRRRAERLSDARHKATQVLTEALSLAEASPAVLGALVEGFECAEARLWLAGSGPSRLDLAGTATSSGGLGRAETPDESVARKVAEGGEAIWVDAEGARGVQAALGVPVRVGGRLLGVLEVLFAASPARDEAWVSALGDIGNQLGLFLNRQRAEADLQRLARYDSLTGLPNRSFFLESLERTLSRAARRGSRAALVFLDLDGFKGVNDRLGHAAGDAVLQAVAERLRGGRAARTSSPGWGATSSPSSSRTSRAPTTRPSWPGGCSSGWPGPSPWTSSRSRSARARASASTPRTARTRGPSSGTPTSPCTGRSRRARAPTASSSPR